jgi:hypothetical protein
MVAAREAIRHIYANAVETQTLKWTLDEMLARGLPKAIYDAYLDEAELLGLIPVIGKSKIDGRLMTKADILTKEDVLKPIKYDFKTDYGFYGIG